jgi:aryl-alcohol dehydrogenase-like predicted oxidoreductase
VSFDEQLDTMVTLRDEGLIAGIGLSNVTVDQLRHAQDRTAIVCVQNAYNLADRKAEPVLRACQEEAADVGPAQPAVEPHRRLSAGLDQRHVGQLQGRRGHRHRLIGPTEPDQLFR